MLRFQTTSGKFQFEISAQNQKNKARKRFKLHKYTCLVSGKALNVPRGFSFCFEEIKLSPSDLFSFRTPAIISWTARRRSSKPSLCKRLLCDWLNFNIWPITVDYSRLELRVRIAQLDRISSWSIHKISFLKKKISYCHEKIFSNTNNFCWIFYRDN